MKNSICLILALFLTLSFISPQEARAEMSPKTKAFLTIAGYGAAGGALLGVASLAFGSNIKAVPQGASLGLYAGIFFGAYVLFSHNTRGYGGYEDNSSPYQESTDIYGDEYDSEDGGQGDGSSSGGFFDRMSGFQEKFENQSLSLGVKNKGGQLPPLKVNLFTYQF